MNKDLSSEEQIRFCSLQNAITLLYVHVDVYHIVIFEKS